MDKVQMLLTLSWNVWGDEEKQIDNLQMFHK